MLRSNSNKLEIDKYTDKLYVNTKTEEMQLLKPMYEYYRMNHVEYVSALEELRIAENHINDDMLFLISHSSVFNNLRGKISSISNSEQ